MKKRSSFLASDNLLSVYVLLIILSFPLLLISCSNGGSTDPYDDDDDDNNNQIGTEPTFANVQMIFTQNCGACHTSDSQNGVRLNNYNNVINSVGDQYGIEVVQPGDADGSPLIDKISSSNPQFGSRMPEGGPYLSSERINQIKEWINQGAENN